MLKIHSLQKRFVLFFFVPVALLLVFMGTVGFLYARRVMIQQWEESAILHLEQSAHSVDMLLARPKELIRLYLESGNNRFSPPTKQAIVKQLSQSPGVLRVIIIPDGKVTTGHGTRRFNGDHGSLALMQNKNRNMNHHYKNDGDLNITLPRYNADVASETVSLIAQTVDGERVSETIEVIIDFKFLIKNLPRSKGWDLNISYLVDDQGHILVASNRSKATTLGQNGHKLAQATLAALTTNMFGTVRGKGFPPDEISGFYRLMEAPWFIVMFAQGSDILKPIIRFHNIYRLTMAVFMLAILMFIRNFIKHITLSARQLSTAANQIAGGRFLSPLKVSSEDEIGVLIQSFNIMSHQLQERMQLKQSLNLAKEVQQNLIPAENPKFIGLDIAGRSDFCEETGGDYYDYIEKNVSGGKQIRIFIGDVVGHGISSALLMSGIRGSIRQRNASSGSIEAVVSAVNQQLSLDVGNSGRFMTLFGLEIDVKNLRAEFVRAGHERGLFYTPHEDRFNFLNGSGIPLGIDGNFSYTSQSVDNIRSGDIFLLTTDGILESTDPEGNMFGKQRLKEIVRTYRSHKAADILEIAFNQLYQFTQNKNLEDDATLIVIKVD